MALRYRVLFAGLGAAAVAATAGSPQIIAAFGDSRTLTLYNIHTKETASFLYKKDGSYVASGLKKADYILRDWRRNETTKMDPKLLDLMWEIHTELGSKMPIHVISGYRSLKTNNLLRRTRGGQAKKSRHILGKAADVHFPDVELKRLRYASLVRERGGVGYYPTSALPFVHIDTGRVRHWPRLPRYELALLFPDGRTKHRPVSGGPISRKDVRVAQSRHRSLSVKIAQFHEFRRAPKTPVLVAANGAQGNGDRRPRPARNQRVAALTPPPPTLVSAPRLVRRPLPQGTRPTVGERSRLARLALAAFEPPFAGRQKALKPRAAKPQAAKPLVAKLRLASLGGALGAQTRPRQLPAGGRPQDRPTVAAPAVVPDGWSNGWAQAPAFDQEHPDELSYRPFPIAPLLTETASSNDPALSGLTHPDAARTLDLLDGVDKVPPLQFRPGRQIAQLLYAQQFAGAAVNLNGLYSRAASDQTAAAAADGLNRRAVRSVQGG